MSTSPEAGARPDDRIVTALSRWLARHVGDEELRREVEAVGLDELAPGQVEAVEELLQALEAQPGRGTLERIARETLEALALGE